MKNIDFTKIQTAAEAPLERLNMIQFGDDVISRDLLRSISEAIADAIAEYDRQRGD